MESLDTEEFLVFAAQTDAGQLLDEEVCRKLLLGKFFDEEVLKLDRWSDDLKQGLEREIKEFDKQIREARRTTALAASLHDKLEAQKAIKALESARNRKRLDLFDAQDAIDSQRDELIGRIEKQLQQRHSSKLVFMFRWRLA